MGYGALSETYGHINERDYGFVIEMKEVPDWLNSDFLKFKAEVHRISTTVPKDVGEILDANVTELAMAQELNKLHEKCTMINVDRTAFMPTPKKPGRRNFMVWLNDTPYTLEELELLMPGFLDLPLVDAMERLYEQGLYTSPTAIPFEALSVGVRVEPSPKPDEVGYEAYETVREAEAELYRLEATLDKNNPAATLDVVGKIHVQREIMKKGRKDFLMISKLSKEN